MKKNKGMVQEIKMKEKGKLKHKHKQNKLDEDPHVEDVETQPQQQIVKKKKKIVVRIKRVKKHHHGERDQGLLLEEKQPEKRKKKKEKVVVVKRKSKPEEKKVKKRIVIVRKKSEKKKDVVETPVVDFDDSDIEETEISPADLKLSGAILLPPFLSYLLSYFIPFKGGLFHSGLFMLLLPYVTLQIGCEWLLGGNLTSNVEYDRFIQASKIAMFLAGVIYPSTVLSDDTSIHFVFGLLSTSAYGCSAKAMAILRSVNFAISDEEAHEDLLEMDDMDFPSPHIMDDHHPEMTQQETRKETSSGQNSSTVAKRKKPRDIRSWIPLRYRMLAALVLPFPLSLVIALVLPIPVSSNVLFFMILTPLARYVGGFILFGHSHLVPTRGGSKYTVFSLLGLALSFLNPVAYILIVLSSGVGLYANSVSFLCCALSWACIVSGFLSFDPFSDADKTTPPSHHREMSDHELAATMEHDGRFGEPLQTMEDGDMKNVEANEEQEKNEAIVKNAVRAWSFSLFFGVVPLVIPIFGFIYYFVTQAWRTDEDGEFCGIEMEEVLGSESASRPIGIYLLCLPPGTLGIGALLRGPSTSVYSLVFPILDPLASRTKKALSLFSWFSWLIAVILYVQGSVATATLLAMGFLAWIMMVSAFILFQPAQQSGSYNNDGPRGDVSKLLLEPNALSLKLSRVISFFILLGGLVVFAVSVFVEFKTSKSVRMVGIPLVNIMATGIMYLTYSFTTDVASTSKNRLRRRFGWALFVVSMMFGWSTAFCFFPGITTIPWGFIQPTCHWLEIKHSVGITGLLSWVAQIMISKRLIEIAFGFKKARLQRNPTSSNVSYLVTEFDSKKAKITQKKIKSKQDSKKTALELAEYLGTSISPADPNRRMTEESDLIPDEQQSNPASLISSMKRQLSNLVLPVMAEESVPTSGVTGDLTVSNEQPRADIVMTDTIQTQQPQEQKQEESSDDSSSEESDDNYNAATKGNVVEEDPATKQKRESLYAMVFSGITKIEIVVNKVSHMFVSVLVQMYSFWNPKKENTENPTQGTPHAEEPVSSQETKPSENRYSLKSLVWITLRTVFYVMKIFVVWVFRQFYCSLFPEDDDTKAKEGTTAATTRAEMKSIETQTDEVEEEEEVVEDQEEEDDEVEELDVDENTTSLFSWVPLWRKGKTIVDDEPVSSACQTEEIVEKEEVLPEPQSEEEEVAEEEEEEKEESLVVKTQETVVIEAQNGTTSAWWSRAVGVFRRSAPITAQQTEDEDEDTEGEIDNEVEKKEEEEEEAMEEQENEQPSRPSILEQAMSMVNASPECPMENVETENKEEEPEVTLSTAHETKVEEVTTPSSSGTSAGRLDEPDFELDDDEPAADEDDFLSVSSYHRDSVVSTELDLGEPLEPEQPLMTTEQEAEEQEEETVVSVEKEDTDSPLLTVSSPRQKRGHRRNISNTSNWGHKRSDSMTSDFTTITDDGTFGLGLKKLVGSVQPGSPRKSSKGHRRTPTEESLLSSGSKSSRKSKSKTHRRNLTSESLSSITSTATSRPFTKHRRTGTADSQLSNISEQLLLQVAYADMKADVYIQEELDDPIDLGPPTFKQRKKKSKTSTQ